MPANGFGTSASPQNVPTTIGAVQDPYSPKDKLAVSVNRRTDVLEWEYSHGRLTEAAYRVGREIQAVFERATGRSASNWSQGDRVDAYASKELQIIHGIMKAETVQTYMDRIVRTVGMVGARFLRAILCDGSTFTSVATARGRNNEAGRGAAASQFRQLLEDLAEEFAARGQQRA